MSATTSLVAVNVGPNPEVRDGPSMKASEIGSLVVREIRQKPDFQ